MAKALLSGSDSSQPCPSCGARTVNAVIVTFAPKLGAFMTWCSTCNRGIHLSRVVVTESAHVRVIADGDSYERSKIPNFELVYPGED
jgi:hypothetical protein